MFEKSYTSNGVEYRRLFDCAATDVDAAGMGTCSAALMAKFDTKNLYFTKLRICGMNYCNTP
jgi:hypothetical protein